MLVLCSLRCRNRSQPWVTCRQETARVPGHQDPPDDPVSGWCPAGHQSHHHWCLGMTWGRSGRSLHSPTTSIMIIWSSLMFNNVVCSMNFTFASLRLMMKKTINTNNFLIFIYTDQVYLWFLYNNTNEEDSLISITYSQSITVLTSSSLLQHQSTNKRTDVP